MCAGASGGGGRSAGAAGEGGGDGTTGGTAGQERERSPEESHQERAAEAQDELQGRNPSPYDLTFSSLSFPSSSLSLLPSDAQLLHRQRSRRRPDDGGGGEALRPLGADQVQLGNRTGFYWADSLKLRVWFVVCRRWMKRWLLGVKSRVKRLWRNRWETHTSPCLL